MQCRVDLDKESPLNEPGMKRCKPSWNCPFKDMDMDTTARAPRTGGRHQQSSTLVRSGDGSIEKGAEECSSSLSSILSGINHNRPATLSWCDSVHNSMQAVASGAHHHVPESSAAYFHWPPSSLLQGTADERASYFRGLQKDVHAHVQSAIDDVDIACGQQASTLLDLMTIRAFHSKRLRQYCLGTAIGFRTRGGVLTDIPAIVVFVARKVHKEWLHELQCLPPVLEGPGGIWCDVDVVEFSYYGTPALAPKEQVYTELVESLRGNDACIGPGSQVASQETYGTLGAIVQSRTGPYQVGFLTNRHVAVDLDYPNQKMFHPLPPNLGPGVYLGAVERATSFITDDLWYGIFASMNPETFVRADGAFIPFGDCFDMSLVTTSVKGVGEMGDVMLIDLQAPVGSIVGRQVVKVGRSSGLTVGSIMAYALEYNDEKGVCFFTDFLIVGENKQAFDLEGDSGSLILMTDEDGCKSRPVGIIWGGTANRGRLKLHKWGWPENWTSGVDLGRLLDLLQLSLISSSVGLAGAAEEQRHWRGHLEKGCSHKETPMGGESWKRHGGCEMTSHSDSLPEQPGGFQSQHLPITTLIVDAYDPCEGTNNDNGPTPPSPSMELELLDFGFALPDTLAEDREPSPHNTRAEELAFGLSIV